MSTRTWQDWSCAVSVTTLAERDLEPAVDEVRAVMAEVEAAASRFHPSDLARINAEAGRFVLVRPLTVRLVELALEVAERTRDAVTPTVGAALVAQGYDADIAVVRARTDAPAAQPSPAPLALRAIRIDRTLHRVGVAAGAVIDLGALAKAYTVDEAIVRITRRRLGPTLVSIGGDLAVHGEESWRIAVSETADAPGQEVTIDSGALATSSTQGRRWARERHHVIDPRTGAPASGTWRTATVWAPSAVEANLLSTWALVDAGGFTVDLEKTPRPVRLVDAGGHVVSRHGWPAEVLESAS